jgi:outer membrane protein OmpA-like peptidoglycan-associated protein
MRSFLATLVAVSLATAVAGCTTDPYTGERQVSKTAIGAGVGALAGAGIGVLIGDHGSERGRNAMIGAGIGALAGGAVGVYMDRQEAALRRRLEGSGVSVTRVGDQIVLNMPGNVTFDVDSNAIWPDFYEVLNSVAIVLKEYDQTLVHVTGHTDSTGGLEHNQLLSQRRAEAVSSYLAAQGLVAARLMARGYGPTRPIATNSTPEGRQQNRRVEITLQPFTG